MKTILCNVRGLTNSPKIFALKRMINIHKPHLVLIDEPWMSQTNLPCGWLDNINMKIFFNKHKREP